MALVRKLLVVCDKCGYWRICREETVLSLGKLCSS